MFEFTPISILVGIILGVIFGILHGIFATYSSAYESNLMGDDVNDMDVNLANAMRSKLSEEDIKAALSNTRLESEKKARNQTFKIALIMFIPMYIAVAFLIIMSFVNHG